jgi:hypothetical protein
MNTGLIEQLLNEDESTSLDFKRAQYPFEGASDEQKSELLKDILAFANAWRRTDSYILIGVEEVKGGRSVVVGVTEHLDDAKLQQFVNSKTQRPIGFSYEALPFESVQVGVIRIPVQARPAYIKQDYGRLKKHTVYVRRGSSTGVAEPDEVSRMGLTSEDYHPRPRLCLMAKATAWDTIVVAIKNEGKGVAKAPYLSFSIPENYRLSPYGVDGNYGEGILGEPSTGSDSTRLRYGAKAGIVIHANVSHDVAALRFCGNPEDRPTADVSIEYELVAENVEPIQGSFTITVQELAEVFESHQKDEATRGDESNSDGGFVKNRGLPNILRSSNKLAILSCKVLSAKVYKMIGRPVGIKGAQVTDLHPYPSGYTQFLLKDPDYVECVIKQGEAIEDVIIELPHGNFYGVIRDDLFNFPFLFVTEYEPIE